jgi:hypothetical protein
VVVPGDVQRSRAVDHQADRVVRVLHPSCVGGDMDFPLRSIAVAPRQAQSSFAVVEPRELPAPGRDQGVAAKDHGVDRAVGPTLGHGDRARGFRRKVVGPGALGRLSATGGGQREGGAQPEVRERGSHGGRGGAKGERLGRARRGRLWVTLCGSNPPSRAAAPSTPDVATCRVGEAASGNGGGRGAPRLRRGAAWEALSLDSAWT